jgi:hypothetical protein
MEQKIIMKSDKLYNDYKKHKISQKEFIKIAVKNNKNYLSQYKLLMFINVNYINVINMLRKD